MDQEFACLTVLSSYPLSHGFENGPPTRSCSAAAVEYHEHRLLLTVAHAVQPDEAWAVELGYERIRGARLWNVGAMQYMLEVARDKARTVDFCFTSVPGDLRAKWQRFSDQGQLVEERERIVLRSGFSMAPQPNVKYGFAGLTRRTSEPAPPGHPHAIAGAELTVETGLTYRETADGLDTYDLGHRHPGDEHYVGCSGAPVLSEHGDLVGLVVCGSVSQATVSALPLRRYRGAVDAALASS